MYLYNISVIIDDSIHQDLLTWIKSLLQERNTQNLKLLKMLHSPHEGQTYCLQVVIDNQNEIEKIQTDLIQDIQAHITEHYPEKAFLFDSLMQYLPHS